MKKRKAARFNKRTRRIYKIVFECIIICIVNSSDCIRKEETLNDHNLTEVNNNIEEKNIYLSLENDPNAEDALYVFKTTEGLLKGTKTYPVRKDGKKVVYLTFDDGPSIENTPKILDILDSYGLKATFCVTGSAVEACTAHKEILKKIARKGHAIANHSYSHDYKKLYPDDVIDVDVFMREIDETDRCLKKVLGKDFNTRVIRFPGGYWSWDGRQKVKPRILERGYAILDWNALNEDAQGKKKCREELIRCSKNTVEALGKDADSIVFLMHDTYGKGETVKALPEIIEYFKSKGFEFRTIK